MSNDCRESPIASCESPYSSAPVVAVVDTGVDPARLEPTRVLRGVNLSGSGAADDTCDRYGHGSEIAKTIVDYAPDARVLPVKLIGDHGYLRPGVSIENAFDWIIANHAVHGIGVVCAAFADFRRLTSDVEFHGSPLQSAIARLREEGVATVAPAGNGFRSGLNPEAEGMAWPAILREVVSVGALDATPGGPRLHESSKRLSGDACRTTVFVNSAPPGGTSGAAAAVAGRLAAVTRTRCAASVGERVNLLLALAGTVHDVGGHGWPALVEFPQVDSAPSQSGSTPRL